MCDLACSIQDFSVNDSLGAEKKLSQLLKKVTLIVNIDCSVGSQQGLHGMDQSTEGGANVECRELQALYNRHKDKGFEILAFPSAVYAAANHTPATAQHVKEDLSRRFHVTFPVLATLAPHGEHAHPLFLFLQRQLHGFGAKELKWGFSKFLVVDGIPRKRYGPTTSLDRIESDVSFALQGGDKPAFDINSSSNSNVLEEDINKDSYAAGGDNVISASGTISDAPSSTVLDSSRLPERKATDDNGDIVISSSSESEKDDSGRRQEEDSRRISELAMGMDAERKVKGKEMEKEAKKDLEPFLQEQKKVPESSREVGNNLDSVKHENRRSRP